MKNISRLSRTIEGKNMTIISRRTSLMAMVLSLSAMSMPLIAADVTYPQPNPTADTVLVTGVVPASVTTGQVKIGAGVIRAYGDIYYGATPKKVNDASGLTGTLNDGRLSANIPRLNTANLFSMAQTIGGTAPTAASIGANQVAIGGGRVASTVAFDSYFAGLNQANFAADALGAFIQWRQSGKSFIIYDDLANPQVKVTSTAPASVAPNQVAIGGGFVSANRMVTVGDLHSGGFRGGRYSASYPYLNITAGWLLGGGSERCGLAFETMPATSAAPNANARTSMKIEPDGNVIIGTTDPNPGGTEILRVGGSAYIKNAVEIDGPDAWLKMRQAGATAFTMQWDNANKWMQYFTTGAHKLIGGPVIIGNDPNVGGAELLRVGGAARFQAAGNVDSNFKSTTATGRAIVGPENDSGSTIQLVAFGNSVSGTTFGSNNANAVMLCATKYGAQDPAIMGIGTFTSTPLILGTNNAERVRLEAGGEIVFKGVAPASVANGEVRMGGGRVMVGGTLSAKEIKVTTTGADYVFADTYRLRPLIEVEQFIKDNRHLPEIPSAKVMQQDGMGVSEIVTKQLAKIEELTLYAIQAERERAAQAAQAEKQAGRLATLEQQVATMAAANAQLMEQMQFLLKQTAIKNP